MDDNSVHGPEWLTKQCRAGMVDNTALGRNGGPFSKWPAMGANSVHGQDNAAFVRNGGQFSTRPGMVDNSVHSQEWRTIEYTASIVDN